MKFLKYGFLITFLFLSNNIMIGKQEFIIQLNKNKDILSLKNKFQQKIKQQKCISPPLKIWLLLLEDNEEKNMKDVLIKHEEIIYIQTNKRLTYRGTTTNDAYFHQQWQYNNNGWEKGIVDADIDAGEAWRITTGGISSMNDTIVVAVIDAGFNLQHPDLLENIWRNHAEINNNGIDDDGNNYIDDYWGWNFKDHTNDVSNTGIGHWHGTPVLGIIGAEGNNKIGVTGINWRVKLMSLVGGETEADILEAYSYILSLRKKYNESSGKEGAFIVATNASWGIDYAFPHEAPLWCAMYDSLGKEGILNVAATANNDVNVDKLGDLPTTCTSDYLIAVTNTNKQDAKIDNAAYGVISIDLAAPGENVFTLLNNGSYGYFAGTSAASPHVTGGIALLYSLPYKGFMEEVKIYPSKSSLLIKNCLLSGTDKLNHLSNYTLSSGRLNLDKSMQKLQEHYQLNAFIRPHYALKLLSVTPNPMSHQALINFSLEQNSATTSIDFYNIVAQKVKSIPLPFLERGIHQRRINNMGLSKGIYFIRLHHNNKSSNSLKVVLI